MPLEAGETRTLTYPEIAKILGCTPQYVHVIEERALAKLQKYCRRHGLKMHDLIDGRRSDPES